MISKRVVGLIGCASLVVGMVLTAAPAHAYTRSQLSVSKNLFDTDRCPCEAWDDHDGTYFEADAGGMALKSEIKIPSLNGRWVGKVEFHPADEIVYVYDTYNDNDSFYVTVSYYNDAGRKIGTGGVMSAPGTDAKYDSKKYNLEIAEGTKLVIEIWDNANATEQLAALNGAVA
jgi:hypothetical protein